MHHIAKCTYILKDRSIKKKKELIKRRFSRDLIIDKGLFHFDCLSFSHFFDIISKRITLTKNLKTIISELTYVNEMTLTIGLALATIGTFLGGIWANESWGRYWGWDAKETWALVIVLTYAVVLHLRLIPGLKSKFIFNVASILSFSSVLMTFIGVNYYLSKGLHSYARGETPAFPLWAWITIFSIFGIIILAWYNKKRLKAVTS